MIESSKDTPLRRAAAIFVTATIVRLLYKYQYHHPPTDYDVIVVGAGFAGLTAASMLQKAGKKVLVMEAHDYVGGRVHTIEVGHLTVDGGAMWIDEWSDANPVQALAVQAGVETFAYNDWFFQEVNATGGDRPITYDATVKSNFSWSDAEHLRDDFLDDLEHLRSDLGDGASIRDAINEYVKNSTGNDDDVERLINYMVDEILVETSYAGDSEHTSLEYFWKDDSFEGGSYLLPNGYSELTDTLAADLSIRLNTPVTSIDTDQRGMVEIRSETETTFTAKQVIVTASLGVLKSGTIIFHPPLPKKTQHAISRMRMGSLEKIVLIFGDIFWSEAGFLYLDNKNSNIPIFYDFTSFYKTPALVGWYGGMEAVTNLLTMTDQEIIDLCLQELSTILGTQVPRPVASYVSRWQEDPYVRGAYSYMSVESSALDKKRLAKPISNKLYFAGEALSTYYGQTHGAMMSGMHVAKAIDKNANLDLRVGRVY